MAARLDARAGRNAMALRVVLRSDARKREMRREKKKAARTPHPDARVEAELQKILMLRRLAGGYETQIKHNTSLVLRDAQYAISDAVRDHGRNSEDIDHISAEQMKHVIEASERRITKAEERVTGLRGELRRVHDEIAELIAKLPDTDLAFLEPPP
jgi:chromosome segregation ATPase